jgi:uncharacterized membrane protein
VSRRLRHRHSGQTLSLAAVFMVALVGGLAMVIDTGMFLVVQRQFQSAADAGALAGAWYYPVCAIYDPVDLTRQVGCHAPPGPLGGRHAQDVASEVARANANHLEGLCGEPVEVPTPETGTTLNLPHDVNAISVTVRCNAGYSFGRILNLKSAKISASAAAAIGFRDADGEMTDMKQSTSDCHPSTLPNPPLPPAPAVPHCLVARLID